MKRDAVANKIFNEKGEMLFVLRHTRPFGWGLAGGKIDEGETAFEACLRETREETGIDVNNSVFVGMSKSVNGRKIYVYETRLDHTPIVKLNRREHLNHRWVKSIFLDQYNLYQLDRKDMSFAGNTLRFVDCVETAPLISKFTQGVDK